MPEQFGELWYKVWCLKEPPRLQPCCRIERTLRLRTATRETGIPLSPHLLGSQTFTGKLWKKLLWSKILSHIHILFLSEGSTKKKEFKSDPLWNRTTKHGLWRESQSFQGGDETRWAKPADDISSCKLEQVAICLGKGLRYYRWQSLLRLYWWGIPGIFLTCHSNMNWWLSELTLGQISHSFSWPVVLVIGWEQTRRRLRLLRLT